MKNLYLSLTIGVALIFSSTSFSQTVIIEENFDAGIPSSYIQYNEDGMTPHASVAEYTSTWITKEDPDDASNTVASATSYFEPIGMADRWLVIPSIELGAFGNHLSWVAKSHDASFAERYLVLISRTDTQIESFTDTIVRVVNEDVNWVNYSYNLSELGMDNETVHVAFVLRSIDGFKFYLDSVKMVKEDPLAIENIVNFNFQVFPNPAVDVINVQSDIQLSEVVIRSVSGTVVARTFDPQVDVSTLESGVYIIECHSEQGVSTKRFIKQ